MSVHIIHYNLFDILFVVMKNILRGEHGDTIQPRVF